ncbi:hypothetical protein MTO96_010047 [Rhipicephalus appendiculatus]
MSDTRHHCLAWILGSALCVLLLRGPRPGIAYEDASGVPTVVTSRVGGDAALPCYLRHATQDSWAVSVSWFKRGLSGPVYTVDMGSGNFLQAKHRPAHLWGGRAYFSSADEPALLMIGDVAAADAGLYVCSALFGNGAQRNSTVRFVVVGARGLAAGLAQFAAGETPFPAGLGELHHGRWLHAHKDAATDERRRRNRESERDVRTPFAAMLPLLKRSGRTQFRVSS